MIMISKFFLKLTKSVTLGIFFSNSVLPVWYLVFKTNLLVSILFTFAANLSYTGFLTTLFLRTSLNLLKSTASGANLPMSNLSTAVFRLAKFVFSAKLEVSTCVTFLRSVFVA